MFYCLVLMTKNTFCTPMPVAFCKVIFSKNNTMAKILSTSWFRGYQDIVTRGLDHCCQDKWGKPFAGFRRQRHQARLPARRAGEGEARPPARRAGEAPARRPPARRAGEVPVKCPRQVVSGRFKQGPG